MSLHWFDESISVEKAVVCDLYHDNLKWQWYATLFQHRATTVNSVRVYWNCFEARQSAQGNEQ